MSFLSFLSPNFKGGARFIFVFWGLPPVGWIYTCGLKPTATKAAILNAIKMSRWLKPSAHIIYSKQGLQPASLHSPATMGFSPWAQNCPAAEEESQKKKDS